MKVPATVRIGSQTYSTDTPLPVSANGYVDVVVRDYLKAYALP